MPEYGLELPRLIAIYTYISHKVSYLSFNLLVTVGSEPQDLKKVFSSTCNLGLLDSLALKGSAIVGIVLSKA